MARLPAIHRDPNRAAKSWDYDEVYMLLKDFVYRFRVTRWYQGMQNTQDYRDFLAIEAEKFGVDEYAIDAQLKHGWRPMRQMIGGIRKKKQADDGEKKKTTSMANIRYYMARVKVFYTECGFMKQQDAWGGDMHVAEPQLQQVLDAIERRVLQYVAPSNSQQVKDLFAEELRKAIGAEAEEVEEADEYDDDSELRPVVTQHLSDVLRGSANSEGSDNG